MNSYEKIRSALGVDISNSQIRYAALVRPLLKPGLRWLDVGCGRQIVPEWAASPDEQARWVKDIDMLVGLDLDKAMREHPLLDAAIYGSVFALPFADQSFDLVSMNMVVEHLQTPELALREVHRVLKPGGKMIAHTSNYKYYLIFIASLIPDRLKKKLVWWLERRAEDDVFPAYYRINTESAVRYFASQTGFKVDQIVMGGSNGSFQRIPLLNFVELLVLKLLSSESLRKFRATISFIYSKES